MSDSSSVASVLADETSSIAQVFAALSWEGVLAAIIILVVAIALLAIVRHFLTIATKRLEKKDLLSQRVKRQFHIIYNVVRAIIIAVAVLAILQIFGVNVGSIVAGLGVAGIVVGFVLQDALRDMVMGFRIVMDNYYTIGDVVRYGTIEGEVIQMTSQTTVLRDLANGDIHSISNRNITEVARVSDVRYIDVELSYDDDPARIEEVLARACARIAELDKVKGCELKGLQSFGENAVVYRIALIAKPIDRADLLRQANGIIRAMLIEAGLSIPYGQLDIHVTNGQAG